MVLMNKPHYKRMIFQHLNDANTYQKPMKNVIIVLWKSLLTKAKKLNLTNISFSTYNFYGFYGLPKVHKSKKINEALQQQNNEHIEIRGPDKLNVRPIVGGPNCPTRPLCQLIDIILKPFLIHIKSHVNDNLDFLGKCSWKNNDSTTLVTFDVKSLYTSIPHNYDLEAISFWIEKHPGSLHLRFSKRFVLESIKIILEIIIVLITMNFTDNGTAMGTIFALIYATLTIGYFEVHFYNICELKWGKEFQEFILENWSCF